MSWPNLELSLWGLAGQSILMNPELKVIQAKFSFRRKKWSVLLDTHFLDTTNVPSQMVSFSEDSKPCTRNNFSVGLFISLICTRRCFHCSDKYQEDLTVESTVLVLSVRAPKPVDFTTPHDTSVTMDAVHAVMNMYTTIVQSLLHQFNVHTNVRC